MEFSQETQLKELGANSNHIFDDYEHFDFTWFNWKP
jgi:hypothetical protein